MIRLRSMSRMRSLGIILLGVGVGMGILRGIWIGILGFRLGMRAFRAFFEYGWLILDSLYMVLILCIYLGTWDFEGYIWGDFFDVGIRVASSWNLGMESEY
jgi:hypothetical protein